MERLYSKVHLFYSDSDYITLPVSQITTLESLDNVTNTCDITINKLDTFSSAVEINIQDKSFVIGSKVHVYLGYYTPDLSNIKNVFIGYLTGFKNNKTNVVLNFDNEMYLCKEAKRIKKSFTSGQTLQDIVTAILPETVTKSKVIDIKPGAVYVKNFLKPSEILNMIKNIYGIFVYFRRGTLYVGHKYWAGYESKYGITGEDKAKTFKFKYPNTTQAGYYKMMENDLDYSIVDKNNYKVKGVSVNNFKSIQYEYPDGIDDPDNVITLNLPDLDLASLMVFVKERWDGLDKGGFTGSITIFGHPIVNVGDMVALEIDLSHIDKSPRIVKETYFVDEIERSFGDMGYQQKLKLGSKI